MGGGGIYPGCSWLFLFRLFIIELLTKDYVRKREGGRLDLSFFRTFCCLITVLVVLGWRVAERRVSLVFLWLVM